MHEKSRKMAKRDILSLIISFGIFAQNSHSHVLKMCRGNKKEGVAVAPARVCFGADAGCGYDILC